MSAGAALFWGGFSSASLYLGQALAGSVGRSRRATGLMMGFGAGTMISALAYELVPESSLAAGTGLALAFVAGALVYYVGDRVIDSNGGEERQAIGQPDNEGSGAAMFLGALLDGIPEAFILGLTLALGGSVSVAFLAAIFVSNIPQGLAGTTSLEHAGYSRRKITVMWGALTVTCAFAALLGFVLADNLSGAAPKAEAFAGGAVLMMLADSMMPEAFEHGGRAVGLATVLGFLVAGLLSVAG
ncbi:ZIP family metal transporter [Marmoricola sp. RAF53]|uniref:ZIP family metal transporter n=1 Tax=Marmoricola sp. RAF53 TaxID=3233059 RepID=UPI003F9BFB1A